MHALEKILAHHAGLPAVSAGEIINCRVDVAGVNDIYLQTLISFKEIQGKQVCRPENVFIFLDHYAPAATALQAQNQKEFREFAKEHNIKVTDINEGVCHQILADQGYSKPGSLMIVTDSHTTTHGAFGAFSTGVGATDMACILKTGELWLRVPEIIRIKLTGMMPEGVTAKDVILYIIGDLGADYAVYQGVEFTGPAITAMSVAQRMTLCNMCTEMGAKATYIQPDNKIFTHLAEVGSSDFTVYETDHDFIYKAEHTYDISALRPQTAAPSSVDNVSDLALHAGIPVDQAYLGSCTGGRLEDIAVAALILEGKKFTKGPEC